jgi:hypothetical protein
VAASPALIHAVMVEACVGVQVDCPDSLNKNNNYLLHAGKQVWNFPARPKKILRGGFSLNPKPSAPNSMHEQYRARAR